MDIMKKASQRRKPRVAKKQGGTNILRSRYIFSYILSFLEQKDRFKYRIVSRSFKDYVNYSVTFLDISSLRLPMLQQKSFLGQFTNLESIVYPRIYKKIQIKTLVNKKICHKVKQLRGFKVRDSSHIESILQYFPSLESIELENELPGNKFILPLSEFILQSIEQTDYISSDIQSLQIRVQYLNAQEMPQLFDKLMGMCLRLNRLFILKGDDGENQQVSLNQFLMSQQETLRTLYVDSNTITRQPAIGSLKLKTLILENLEEIKGFQFHQVIDRLIIKSQLLSRKSWKYLISNLCWFKVLDLSSSCAGWLQYIYQRQSTSDDVKYKIMVEKQAKPRVIRVYVDQETLTRMQAELADKNITILNWSPIDNLFQYF